ncbi:TIFY domain protein 8 isoform X2 [Wolffia australiana]
MAVVSMGGTGEEDGGKPVFHDFLGISPGEASPSVLAKSGLVDVGKAGDSRVSGPSSAAGPSVERGFASASSDLGAGTPVHGRISGRKRANSDSVFMGFPGERATTSASGFPGGASKLKILPKEGAKETQRRPGDEAVFGIEHPRMTSQPLLIHQSPISRLDQTLKSREMMQHISSLGHNAAQMDKIMQAAADEGSRTGSKNSKLFNLVNPGGDKAAGSPRINEPDLPNTLSHNNLPIGNRQMTIFYAGQAHVFDDVSPNKADVIMTLAGSDGGSWSTSFTHKSTTKPPLPGAAEETVISNSPSPLELSRRLYPQSLSNQRLGQPHRFPTSGDRAVREMRPMNSGETEPGGRRNVP